MTNEQIQEFIDRRNSKSEPLEVVYEKVLSESVVYVAFRHERNPKWFHVFFFIQNANGLVVGAVYDMEQDIHWYVDPNHRKKGHLTTALKNVIIPHLLTEKEFVRIHMDYFQGGYENTENSLRVAKNVGFEAIPDTTLEFQITKKN